MCKIGDKFILVKSPLYGRYGIDEDEFGEQFVVSRVWPSIVAERSDGGRRYYVFEDMMEIGGPW